MKAFLRKQLANFKLMPWDAKLAYLAVVTFAVVVVVSSYAALILAGPAGWVGLAAAHVGLFLVWCVVRLTIWDIDRK